MTPTNRMYRTQLRQHGIPPRTLLSGAPSKARIQHAARAWVRAVPPDRTSMRLNLCESTSHTVLKQYRFRPQLPLHGGAAPVQAADVDYGAIFQAIADRLAATYHCTIRLQGYDDAAPPGARSSASDELVHLRYTINDAPFTMTQPRAAVLFVNDNTIERELEDELNRFVCQGVPADSDTLPQRLDRTEGNEPTTRVQCATHAFAVLEPGQSQPRHVSSDPLQPEAT